MRKIGDIELYVGTKEEADFAFSNGMKVVIALNRVKGFITHQSIVGWSGRGCNKDNPYYLFKETDEYIALNLIDTDRSEYISNELINNALAFINDKIENGEKVFIYCSLGESRSPSIALMYLLQYQGYDSQNAIIRFKQEYYPEYTPKLGFVNYIENRWY